MPIKGLTDRAPQFPCIGELRKGDKKPDDKHIGKDLNENFRFTSKDEAIAAEFAAVYGDKPAAIHVYLPFATAAENFEAWQEEWVAGGLVHRCDGETCVLWYDSKANKYRTDKKPCPGKCKQIGRLRVIVPELRRLAYVTVLTTSKHDILNMTENLLAYESLRGDLRGIPFVLHRTKKLISTPSGQGGQRARREKWLLTIEPMPQWVELQLTAQEQAATPLLEARTGGVVVDSATGEIIRGNGGPEWFDDDDDLPDDPGEEPPANSEPDIDAVFPRNDPPPAPPAKPRPQTSKVAVKTNKWSAAAVALAQEHPYYQTDGRPNFYKMLAAAAKHAGVTEITDANLPDVIAALTAHAVAEMEPKPGDVVEPDGLLL